MAVNVITSAPNPAFYDPSTQFDRQGSILYKRINPQSAVTVSDKTVNGQPSTRLNRYFTTLRFGNKSTLSPCLAAHQSTSGSRPPQRPRTTVDGIRKFDGDKCIPETSDKQRITPDLLIEKLVERGVGRPKIYRHPPLPSEIITYRHYVKRHQIPFYLEKLKGKSRIDCDIANAKAMAFCEEHRDASDVQARTYSPLFRSRVLYQGAIKSGSSDGGGRSLARVLSASETSKEYQRPEKMIKDLSCLIVYRPGLKTVSMSMPKASFGKIITRNNKANHQVHPQTSCL